jgi:oligopeptide transport system substrate-binding protein
MSADMCRFIKGAQDAHDNALDVADMTDVGVVALDDYTLEITLEMVCPYFIKIVGGNAFAPQRADFAVEHESTWSLKGGYPCVGPFMVSEVSENESVTLVKNPNYHDAENVKLDQITYLVMPDENAQLAAFKSGQIDVAYAVPSAIASSAEYADYFYRPEAYMSSYFVALNSGTKGPEALKDVRVRKALSMAIDKNIMLTILDAGDYIVPLNGWVPYGFEGLNGDFRSEANDYVTTNVEEAKKLLAEAGYNESNPLKLEYLYSSNQFHADVAQMLQQFWSAIGVQVELKAVEMGVFYDYVDYGDFQMSRYALNSTVDPLSYLKIFMTENQIEPMTMDPTFDKMVADAYNIIDPTEYIEALHAAEEYLVKEQAYMIPLFTQIPVVLKQPYVEGTWVDTAGYIKYENAYIAG